MGHHCTTDICRNVVYLGEYFGSLLTPDELGEESDGERNEDGTLLIPAIDEEWESTPIAKAGWKLDHIGFDENSEAKELGKRSRLNAFHKLTKGEFVCYLINSSQYSNVGEYEWTLIGETQEAAAEFIGDSGGALDLLDDDSVETWGLRNEQKC